MEQVNLLTIMRLNSKKTLKISIIIKCHFFLPALNKDHNVDMTPTESVCKCQDYSTCAWSYELVTQLAFLPINFPFVKFLKHKIQTQVCDPKKYQVWCCRDGEPANESELKILNKKTDNGCDSKVNSKPLNCWEISSLGTSLIGFVTILVIFVKSNTFFISSHNSLKNPQFD